MSLNSFILSTFATRTKFTTSVESTRLRYQTLCCIYINILTTFAVMILDTTTYYYFNSSNSFYMATCVVPSALASLYCVAHNQGSTATGIMICYINIANFIVGDFGRNPALSFTGLPAVLFLNYFLTNTVKAFATSLLVYIPIFSMNVCSSIQELVTVESDDGYGKESISLCLIIIVQIYCVALLLMQKYLDQNVWNTALSNYRRSEALTQEVLESSQAKDRFVSSLSHEIRNPLNSLKGVIDYLFQVITIPDQLKLLETAKVSCEILLNMANNILDAAKLQADKMELSLFESSIGEIIRKVLIINSEKMKLKNINVKVCLDNTLPNEVFIDPSRLTQIMVNLLSNALKFTPKDGKIEIKINWCSPNINKNTLLSLDDVSDVEENHQDSPRLRALSSLGFGGLPSTGEFDIEHSVIRYNNLNTRRDINPKSLRHVHNSAHLVRETELWTIVQLNSVKYHDEASNNSTGFLKIQVTDTGPGIAAEHIPKLFEMFVQAHQSVVTMYGGTGLGLWICKQLCRKMDGDIKLYSELRRGTSLVFYVPVKSNPRVSINEIPEYIRSNKVVNVMIVDDYATNRDLHRLLVEKEGAHAILCSSGQDAVERYKTHQEGYFDFIMMDVSMPGMNGFVAAQKIRDWERAQNRVSRVDIYFVSGEYYDETGVMQAFRRTENVREIVGIKHIVKPIDADVVKRTIQNYK